MSRNNVIFMFSVGLVLCFCRLSISILLSSQVTNQQKYFCPQESSVELKKQDLTELVLNKNI